MDIFRCISKIHPDWKGSVTGNCFEGIKANELETKPIPSLKELEAIWPEVETEIKKEKINSDAKEALKEIDLKSIRAIREWVSKQVDAPSFLKDQEVKAIAERKKFL